MAKLRLGDIIEMNGRKAVLYKKRFHPVAKTIEPVFVFLSDDEQITRAGCPFAFGDCDGQFVSIIRRDLRVAADAWRHLALDDRRTAMRSRKSSSRAIYERLANKKSRIAEKLEGIANAGNRVHAV